MFQWMITKTDICHLDKIFSSEIYLHTCLNMFFMKNILIFFFEKIWNKKQKKLGYIQQKIKFLLHPKNRQNFSSRNFYLFSRHKSHWINQVFYGTDETYLETVTSTSESKNNIVFSYHSPRIEYIKIIHLCLDYFPLKCCFICLQDMCW